MHKVKAKTLQLDSRCRTVTVSDRKIVLQEKSWQVLSILVSRAPEVVSRADIIAQVWRGNFLTGEKGLNQAIWTIRAALADDSQKPNFIRTVPRVGYQWVYSGDAGYDRRTPETPTFAFAIGIAASFAVLGMTIAWLADATGPATVPNSSQVLHSPTPVATRAYLVDQDIHVEFASGCLGIMRNADNKIVGEPMLSADGTEVVVPVREPDGCRLLTIDVASGEKRSFDSCPTV